MKNFMIGTVSALLLSSLSPAEAIEMWRVSDDCESAFVQIEGDSTEAAVVKMLELSNDDVPVISFFAYKDGYYRGNEGLKGTYKGIISFNGTRVKISSSMDNYGATRFATETLKGNKAIVKTFEQSNVVHVTDGKNSAYISAIGFTKAVRKLRNCKAI